MHAPATGYDDAVAVLGERRATAAPNPALAPVMKTIINCSPPATLILKRMRSGRLEA